MARRQPGFWDRSARQCHSALPSLIIQHINRPRTHQWPLPQRPVWEGLTYPGPLLGWYWCGVSRPILFTGLPPNRAERPRPVGLPELDGNWRTGGGVTAVGAVSGMATRLSEFLMRWARGRYLDGGGGAATGLEDTTPGRHINQSPASLTVTAGLFDSLILDSIHPVRSRNHEVLHPRHPGRSGRERRCPRHLPATLG